VRLFTRASHGPNEGVAKSAFVLRLAYIEVKAIGIVCEPLREGAGYRAIFF
jgi:hypothetical protein